MAPAFNSWRQALGFAVMLVALLISPYVVDRLKLVSRSDVYTSMPEECGAFCYLNQQIFKEKSDLDIAFLGYSRLWVGIDTPYVQRELSAKLGRDAQVISLGYTWPSEDRTYLVLRDLLQHRKVKLAVLLAPERDEIDKVCSEPCIYTYRLFQLGEHSDVLAGLPFRSKAALLAGTVLGLPRNLLSSIRPNLIENPPAFSDSLGMYKMRLGYDHTSINDEASFIPFTAEPPRIQPEEMIYGAASQDNFHFSDHPLPAYEKHFVRKMGDLLHEHNVKLVVLHVPRKWSEPGERYTKGIKNTGIRESKVEAVTFWPDVFGCKTSLVGVPPARIFAGLSDEDVKKLYLKWSHLNANGNSFYTRVITPALLDLYDKENDF